MASKSGGACFSPRLAKRPQYPPWTTVATKTALSYLRVPGICLLVTLSVQPTFSAIVEGAKVSGYSERQIFCAFTLAVHTVAYCSVNGFFFAAERFGWFTEYRFGRKPFQRPTQALLRRTWLEAFINQIVTGPVAVWYSYLAFQYFGMPALDSALPAAWKVFGGYLLAHLFNDWFFYWAHRSFHAQAIYKHVHKQHHMYNGSIGFAAEFAAPLEQILANQIPSIGGCLFFGAHPLVLWVWIFARLQQTYEGHSGFCFNGTFLHRIGLTNSEAAAYHDFHHSGNRGNFGALWLDWACGTMDAWLELGGTEGYIEQCRKIAAANNAAATAAGGNGSEKKLK